jgi:hypothetical protein
METDSVPVVRERRMVSEKAVSRRGDRCCGRGYGLEGLDEEVAWIPYLDKIEFKRDR